MAFLHAQSPSSSQNYVQEITVRAAGHKTIASLSGLPVDAANRTIRYFDGLGRPLQTVQWQGSPGRRDLVTPVAYDAFGREDKKYLPYVATAGTSNGSYKASGISDQNSFYTSPGDGTWNSPNVLPIPGSAFSQTVFEASPLNRVLEQGAPGSVWQPGSRTASSGRSVLAGYGANNSSTAYSTTGFAVRLYSAVAVTATGHEYERILNGTGYYDEGKLYLSISKDENWLPADGKAGSNEEYKDKDGRVVLKRSFNIVGTTVQVLSTYYVYDAFGSLSFVLPPGANPDGTALPDQTMLDNFCYQYRYDGRRRLIEKKLPGKGWEEVIYNPLDQVVFTQDAVQRAGAIRSFIKYDALGRTVMTGVEIGHHETRAGVQGTVNTIVPYWETRDNTAANYHGYNNQSCPFWVPNLQPHVVNYYDNYDIPGIPDNQSSSYSNKTKGLLTASKTLVLGTADTFLWTVNYYDEEGRIARSWQQHYKGGVVSTSSYDQNTFTYNFSGELTSSVRAHVTGGAVTTIVSGFGYDHVGRKHSTTKQINNGSVVGSSVVLDEFVYNEIGQLSQKKLHNGMQWNYMNYNERGWLKSSTCGEFSIQLDYNENGGGQYNGNISRQFWSLNASPSTSPNVFSYSYDKLNRLTSGISSGVSMSEVLTYDNMGNISQLSRNGGSMNQYHYDGNRLASIDNVAGTYAYDANGNATTDGRTGMQLSYNTLNLPSGANGNGKSIQYVYDASGNKLRKIASENGLTTVREYIDGIEYEGSNIDIIHTEEGVAQRNGDNSYSYHYNLSDHLGNVRYTFDVYNGQIRPLQVDNYYPFGKRNSLTSGNNKYLYNGKEVQDELGGQIDYGARFYDPETGRWNAVDPLAEKGRRWSPYSYGFNNPIYFVDPDGMWPGQGFLNNLWSSAVSSAKAQYGAIINGVASIPERVRGLSKKSPGELAKSYGRNYIKMLPASQVVNYVHDEINAVKALASGDGNGLGNIAGRNFANASVAVLTDKTLGLVGKGVSSLTTRALSNSVKNVAGEMNAAGIRPATVGGAELDGQISIATSGTPPTNIAPQLEQAAQPLGGFGTVNSAGTVGACCEIHNANELLLKNPSATINDINFTPAIRPRTGKVVPMCNNCKVILNKK